jgi:hypothetical protein
LILLSTHLYSTTISNYQAENRCYLGDGREYRLLRSFRMDSKKMVLRVETSTLTSSMDGEDRNLSFRECNRSSRYSKLLDLSSSPPYPLENDGLVAGDDGVFITTDLCPSSKKFYERRVYKFLAGMKRSQKGFNGVPVTLFITKRWIEEHKKAFQELKSWDENGTLSIVWGNHTAYHHYHPKAPLNRNFVLSPEENLTRDVFDLEIELIKNGLVPSIFFRFPGLVSDKKSVEMIKDLGLIVVGSNCWLAKGQKIKRGSIILLHGNGNEPKGVDMFLKALNRSRVPNPKSIRDILENREWKER